MILGVLAALAAALSFAGCSVLQHRTARTEPRRDAWLLLRLVRRPLWLAGGVLNGVGVALQGLALSRLSVLVVAPLRLVGLPLALPLDAVADRARVRGTDLAAAALCAGGGAGFILCAGSAPGRDRVSWAGAVAMVVAVAVVDLVGLLVARVSGRRFVALAAAGGVLNGINAVALKTVTDLVGDRDGTDLAWAMPLVIAIGLLALLRTQQGLQAPAIGAPLAAMTIAEPIAAVCAGALLLGEQTDPYWAARLGQVLFAVAGLAGAALLRYREGRPACTRLEQVGPRPPADPDGTGESR